MLCYSIRRSIYNGSRKIIKNSVVQENADNAFFLRYFNKPNGRLNVYFQTISLN